MARNKEAGCEENVAAAVRQFTPADLDNEARAGLLLTSGEEGRASRVLEDFPDALTGPC